MKILLSPMTAGGDFHPVVAAAVGLRDRGHEVLVYTEHDGTRALTESDLPVQGSPRELDFANRLMSVHDDAKKKGGSASAEALVEALDGYSRDMAASMHAGVVAEFQPDLFITSLVGGGLARELKGLTGLPTCIINSDFYIGQDPPRPLADDFDDRCIPEIEDLAVSIQEADLVLHAVDKHFDYDFDGLPEHNRYVGPLLWERETMPPDYLTKPGGHWALVSISSQKQDDVRIARLALEAFESLPVQIVETIGRGHRRKELGPIPADVHIEHYVPHSAVLTQAEVVVTHCGIGSVHKALWYGVPMVLVPWGRDQKGVAARAARLGAGLVLPPDDLTEERLHEAAREILDEPRFKEAALATRERFHADEPVRTTCETIEEWFSDLG